MVIESSLKGCLPVCVLTITGQRDQHYVFEIRLLTDLFRNFIPIHFRQANVQEHHVGFVMES